jgi:hypothetical protein
VVFATVQRALPVEGNVTRIRNGNNEQQRPSKLTFSNQIKEIVTLFALMNDKIKGWPP